MTQFYGRIEDPRHCYLQPYTALNPHPRAQTFYSYPLGLLALGAITTVLNTSYLACKYFELNPIFSTVLIVLCSVYLVVLVLIHPAVGPRRRVVIETGDGKEIEMSVRRPLFGRTSCQVKMGVEGQFPWKEYESWWTGRKYKVRQESALWLVGSRFSSPVPFADQL